MTVTLPIQERTTTKGSAVDLKNRIPGVVYGPKQKSTAIVVDRKEFEKIFKLAGESTVIELSGLASPVSVLIKEVSFAPTKGGIVHIDFYALEKGKEIITHVPLHFIGEAPVSKLGAVINKVAHEVTVACQASDLPAHLEIDLGVLVAVEDRITASQITLPKGVKIVGDLNEVVAIAEAVEEETEIVTPTVDMVTIEVEKKGKEGEEV